MSTRRFNVDEDAPSTDQGFEPHFVQFYEQDAFLAEEVARFVGDGLARSEGAIVLATPAHRHDIEERLRARGVDLVAAREERRYISLDAVETLSRFMRDGRPDRTRFTEAVGGAIACAAGGEHRSVRVFGEMVALLWVDGNREAAIRVEELWNSLPGKPSFSLMCAYPIGAFNDPDAAPFLRVCAEHSRIIPAESYSGVTGEGRRRAVAELQQKASALDAATAGWHAAEDLVHRQEQEIQERNETLGALVEASPLPIVVIEADTTVRLWNPAAERLFGWAAAEVMGRPIPIVPPEKVIECRGVREAIAGGESVHRIETFRIRRDGSQVEVAISTSPLASSRTGALVLLFQDLTERKPAEEARARLAAIVESSDDAIVGKTLEGIVTSWNQGAERMFGYTAEEMIGQPIAGLVPPDRADDVAKILATVRRGERVGHFETERLRKDGHRISVSLTVSPIRDSAGRIIGASKIARDVTDRKRADAEREKLFRLAEQSRVAAELANRAKDKFLAMLGHELRNPLSALRNSIACARLDEHQRERALEIAGRQSDQLTRLVEDLLDMARITQGRISLRKERVYLAEVVERAIESTRSLIEDQGHALSLSLPPYDLCVDGDPTRLEQIIVNLLSNAAKFTPKGGRIVFLAERRAQNAVLRVRDNGVGITPDMLPRVFDLFVQAEAGLDRSQGGLGIGLSVVRTLVGLHGGQVDAYSDGLGHGAEFVVRLPALPAAAQESFPEKTAADGLPRHTRSRVLLVEDNPDTADSLAMLLHLLGHDVRVVHDGLAALDAARTSMPDIMLVDIGLPGIDGYEVARRIRQRADLKNVVLVALTGYGQDEDRRCAFAAGFDHHLVKPIELNELQGLIDGFGKDNPVDGKPETLH